MIVPSQRYATACALARLPGLIASGITHFDETLVFPIPPIDIEKLYGDVNLWSRVTSQFSRHAAELEVEIVVGAEAAGIPLAAAVAIKTGLPCGYVRKPGYKKHVVDEPSYRGASLNDRRIMLVDDALWTGSSLETFAGSIDDAGGQLVSVAAVVDMRELAASEWAKRAHLFASVDISSCCSYYELLQAAADVGVISTRSHSLIRSFIEESWSRTHPYWDELDSMSVNTGER